jgi:glycosyltransferase involved in cell wall biosynthesis
MKILYVFRALAVWGGIERILVEKMNYLARSYGYEVVMLTVDQGNHPIPYFICSSVWVEDLRVRLHQQYRFCGVRRLYEGARLSWVLRQRLNQKISEIRPDVIVCVATSYAEVIIPCAGNVPVVVESHSVCTRTFPQKNILQYCRSWLLKRQLHKAQVIVSLTDGDAKEWRRHFPRVTVIPNMVHRNESETFSDTSSKHVIFVGRFDYQKRVMDAVAIWQCVYPYHPDWHLDIYGEGDGQAELHDRAEKLDINITVHPPTDCIFDKYFESAFLISTSLFEPFGLVLIEAMSCGLPVVAFDCPYGPAEIITDGVDGFLVRDRNLKCFADKVCQLIENPDLRQQMGQAAIRSSQRYQADRIMPAWHELFGLLGAK